MNHTLKLILQEPNQSKSEMPLRFSTHRHCMLTPTPWNKMMGCNKTATILLIAEQLPLQSPSPSFSYLVMAGKKPVVTVRLEDQPSTALLLQGTRCQLGKRTQTHSEYMQIYKSHHAACWVLFPYLTQTHSGEQVKEGGFQFQCSCQSPSPLPKEKGKKSRTRASPRSSYLCHKRRRRRMTSLIWLKWISLYAL